MNTFAIEKIILFMNGNAVKEYAPNDFEKARQDMLDLFDKSGKTCFLKYIPAKN